MEAGRCRIGDCQLNFSDLDEVFSYPGPMVIKTTLDVLPANGKIQYILWYDDNISIDAQDVSLSQMQ